MVMFGSLGGDVVLWAVGCAVGCNCGRDLGVVCGVAGARVIFRVHDMGVTSGQQYRVAITAAITTTAAAVKSSQRIKRRSSHEQNLKQDKKR